jgi:hypothetical protein
VSGRARALVNKKLITRLVRLCGMFGSDHIGERANAAAMADHLVRQMGLTWPDVLADVPEDWQAMAKVCRNNAHLFNTTERRFISTISTQRWQPSDKQLRWLTSLYERLQHQETAA